MFVTSKKYRKLLKERNDLFDEVVYLKQENKTLFKNAIGLPMLTETETDWLYTILDNYSWDYQPYRQAGLNSNQIKVLRSLIKKGYLQRVARGEYQLTFNFCKI